MVKCRSVTGCILCEHPALVVPSQLTSTSLFVSGQGSSLHVVHLLLLRGKALKCPKIQNKQQQKLPILALDVDREVS